ncbi:MAG: class II aldolase/adducin family protein [Dactylosporangium sp.]|nr:class II aldolase/adducin family protein [Dactylosporangium sp.]
MASSRVVRRWEESDVLLGELREAVVQVGLEALRRGIVHGTAGNFSIRDRESGLIAISPSGMPYPTITPADVVIVDEDGTVVDGCRRPSSETPMHTMILKAYPRIRAIVHTHSHYSTVVGTIRDCLPPILTEVCCVVGERVPVTRYGLTGLPDIGDSILEVMDGETRAVLMKNHGLITFGDDLDEALLVSEIVEESAKVYINALAANGGREPDLVPRELIPGMRERFIASYGQPK